MRSLFLVIILSVCFAGCKAQKNTQSKKADASITPGAERISYYLPLIKGKKVGIFANNTSMVGNTHLVDTLQKLGVDIKVIFGPEHGFRGRASAGEHVSNEKDPATGIPVVSLYGNKRKPSAEDVKDVDILMFDIQDVGVRFYTYISSLQDYIEAAIEFNKPLIILDRPNPNGFYVDGPVLDPKFKSFIGMQPVPIVYGMTIGEYAKMLLFEKMIGKDFAGKLSPVDTIDGIPAYPIDSVFIAPYFFHAKWFIEYNPDSKRPLSKNEFEVAVIECANYNHKSKYVLPIKPSPNIPDIQSIYLYPSTCLFEGTVLSEGRGTPRPFQVFGDPSLPKNLYSFTPKPNEGAKSSKHYGEVCYGWDLGGTPEEVLKKVDGRIQFKWLIEAYKLFPQKDSFFLKNNFINRLAGNDVLKQQIIDGKSEDEIRKSWEPALTNFKKIRKKYLLYEDFE